MFERRLKIFVAMLAGFGLLLLARAAQLQIVEGQAWQQKASESLRRSEPLETIRGSILDVRGRRLAVDEPCIDAAVDYRAVIREGKWMEEQARSRLRSRDPEQYARADRAARKRLLEEEKVRLGQDLDRMWRTLAEYTPQKTLDEIEMIKSSIRRRVDMRRRYVWYKRFQQARDRYENREPEAWLKEWLLSSEPAPELESFDIQVSEQTEAHVILPDISPETHTRLRKLQEGFPGLVLRPGKHRHYPYQAIACHILGSLSNVTREDLKNDPNAQDDLRRYYYNDLIGRSGIEALCDQALRGSRGRVVYQSGRDPVVEAQPVPGRDVRLSIDLDLQREIQKAFEGVEFWEKHDGIKRKFGPFNMHGAAVVIDVPSGEIRALVSNPVFDLNRFQEDFPSLAIDDINHRLMNRATEMAIQPGSTVKPIVGIGAAMAGLTTPHTGIECKGFLYIDGRKMSSGRCWVAKFVPLLGEEGVAHHPIPDPHPTGFLTLSDALERSCNVYFETLGDKMGLEGLSRWYERFGLGRKVDIGLREVRGSLPRTYRGPLAERRSTQWFSAIGQRQVLATPLQMANVAATIARDGVWLRPRLLANEEDRNPASTSQAASSDRVDLHIPPEVMAAVKEGMYRVVNAPAGTGHGSIHVEGLSIAGKTGSAQAAAFTYPKRNERGEIVRNAQGRIEYEQPPASTSLNPNARMLWYRGVVGPKGIELSHAWFIGYAPADRPRVAFAVVLEYGGSGGTDAAPVVRALLEACVKYRYLAPRK